MEIKSFILPISRQYFLSNLDKYDLSQYVNHSLSFISFCLDRWFFSHNRDVKVILDNVQLPKIKEIAGESIEEEVKRQIEALPKEILFNCQILTKEGKAEFIYVSLYNTDVKLDECLNLLKGASSLRDCIYIYDEQLADFISNSKDKKQTLKMWAKDYLENEYPKLSFTVENDEGVEVSSTEAIKEFCELSNNPYKWGWAVYLKKDENENWVIYRMIH